MVIIENLITKTEKEQKEIIVSLIKKVIKDRNYDFEHWYEYDFSTDIYVDSEVIRCMKDDDEKESIKDNYSDFIYSQYESIMEDVGKQIFGVNKNGFVNWDAEWSDNFKICDMLEDLVKNEFWCHCPI